MATDEGTEAVRNLVMEKIGFAFQLLERFCKCFEKSSVLVCVHRGTPFISKCVNVI